MLRTLRILKSFAGSCGRAARPPRSRALHLDMVRLESRVLMASFQGLGAGSSASAVSANGSVVVGNVVNQAYGGPFFWTHSNGVVFLHDSSGNVIPGVAKAVSGNGSIIVGGMSSGSGGAGGGLEQAFEWANGVAAPIPQLASSYSSAANSVLTDGTIIAGDVTTSSQYVFFGSSFTLTRTTLQVFPPSSLLLNILGTIMSFNGAVVAGNIEGGAATSTPFQWVDGGMVRWPGSTYLSSSAAAVSPDGSVVAGSTGFLNDGAVDTQPFEWTNGVVTTLPLPSGFINGSALGVSNYGSTIVGYMTMGGPGIFNQNSKAFIWNQAKGVQDLQQALTADGLGSELAGWTLTEATAVTPDGKTIVGNGTDPQGQHEGWIVHLDISSPPPLPPAPMPTWPRPADIVYGTPLSATQLDATDSVPGTFVYSPSSDTILHAGAGQTLSVTFEPADTKSYSAVTASVSINVLRATPTITWANPADIDSGTQLGPTQLDARATSIVSGNPVNVPGTLTYSPPAGNVLAPGNDQPLRVSFTPNDVTDYTSTTATVTINVLQAPPLPRQGTSTLLKVNPGISKLGQTVKLSATVKSISPGGGTPTGQVDFLDDSVLIGTVNLSKGKANLRTSRLHFGSDAIQAIYGGDRIFNVSTSNVRDVTVNGATTKTSATSSRRTSLVGQPVKFNVTVKVSGKGHAIPTGSVFFWDGPAPIGPEPLIGGKASLTTSTLSARTHTIRVVYEGDAGFSRSSTSLKQMVKQPKPSVARVTLRLLHRGRSSRSLP